MATFVSGGAGYVGLGTVKYLLETTDEHVIVFDNFSASHRFQVEEVMDANPGRVVLSEGNLGKPGSVSRAFKENPGIDSVMHFAAYSLVAESMENPDKYLRENPNNTQNILDAMDAHNVKHFIFSSTAAVYGIPEKTPITEDQTPNPINPYGHGKLHIEQMLAAKTQANPEFKSVSLRYFNAAGAPKDAQIGEARTITETHLIPLVMATALGELEQITLCGADYDTPDGTCIRDYIHVTDLADAHVKALQHIRGGGESITLNLGSETGFSVREVIDAAKRITGVDFKAVDGPRRPGDPPILVASADRAKKVLGWDPSLSDLDTILETAWQWHKRLVEKI